MARLILSAFGINGDELDFDAWAAYVESNLPNRAGFVVGVDQFRYDDDEHLEDWIEDASFSECKAIKGVLNSLWDEYRSTPAAWSDTAWAPPTSARAYGCPHSAAASCGVGKGLGA